MGAVERIGPQAPPAAVMAILDRFNRDELGNAIEVLVALLDIWDGDPEAEITEAEDEFAEHGQRPWHGPGDVISDPPEDDDDDTAVDDARCDDPFQDLEREGMVDDVPMLPVIALDTRAPLGISNLQSSFVGQDVRSADSGAIHNGRPMGRDGKPGAPV